MPKEPPFDPCRQWLGIDAVELGDPRRVLGIAAGEIDAVAVARAADARLRLLRSLSPGPFEMARTALVKRVEEARDKVLAEVSAAPAAAPAVSGFAMPAPPSRLVTPPPPRPGVPVAPPPVPGQAAHAPVAEAPTFSGQIKIRTTVYRKQTPWVGITLAILALAAAAGGLGYYAFVVRPQERPGKASRELAKADRGREPAARRPEPRSVSDEVPLRKDPMTREEMAPSMRPQPAPAPRPEPATEQRPEPATESPAIPQMAVEEQPAKKPAPADDMGDDLEDGATDTRLAEVLAALRAGATKKETQPLLEAAFKGAKSALGRRRVEAWQQLAGYYRGFLDYRDKALAAVAPGDEFDVKSQRIIVSEIDEQVFKFRSLGENKTVPRDKIPAGIVLAIVTRYLENGANPANELFVGAYHLVKRESNAALAQEHWERAQAGGADATTLMKLLEDPVFAQGVEPE